MSKENKRGKEPILDGDDVPLFKDQDKKNNNNTSPKLKKIENEQKNKERKMRSAFWFVVGSVIIAVIIYLLETFCLKNMGIGKEILEILKVVIYTSIGYLFSKKDKE